MKREWDSVVRNVGIAAAAGAAALLACPSLAQPSAPPPLPAASATRPAAQKPVEPRSTIQLSPAERQAIDNAQGGKEKPATADESLAPTAEDMKPRQADENNATRIEQKHVSNRVSEVIVTPAGQSRSYVMTNREGQQAFGTGPMGSGNLSVPMFFRFEFGRATPAPSANPPPPPAQSPSR